MTNYESAKIADSDALNTLWKECWDFIRVNEKYRKTTTFAKEFAELYDYNWKTVAMAFNENPENRQMSEKLLLEILEFFGMEVKKHVRYEIGADVLEPVPEEINPEYFREK